MDISLLDNITVEKRTTPYYGKYEYCARFTLPGARKTMYNRTIQEFNESINQLREEAEYYYPSRRNTILSWIDSVNPQHISHFINLKRRLRKSKEISIYVGYTNDVVKLYSNNPELFKDFVYEGFTGLHLYKSDHSGNREIMYFSAPPKHKYRLYLKYKRVDEHIKNHIRNIIEYNDLHPSPSLNRWLNKPNSLYNPHWVRGTFNISYNDESMYTLLQLSLNSDLIGKHYELRQR